MTISLSGSVDMRVHPEGLIGEFSLDNEQGLDAKGPGSLKALRQAFEEMKAKAQDDGLVALWATPCSGPRLEARKEVLRRAGFQKSNAGWVLMLDDEAPQELVINQLLDGMSLEPAQPFPSPREAVI
jgi:hypothetical protein